MKKVLFASIVAFIVFGLTSLAAAVPSNAIDDYAVQFYAIDDGRDEGNADIAILDFSDPLLGDLFYKVGSGVWSMFAASTDLIIEVPTTEASDWKNLVALAFRKVDGSYLSPFSIAFLGESLTNHHYDSLLISWTALSKTYIYNANGDDNLMPVHTPLPGAFWLFGSGILCLAGYRTRKQS
ncbi:MAG: hypothetical protein KKC46_11660 [Proteobacteria bacterium]|nr:hypothetical protein [Pseudomonadota bacterium]